MDYEQIPEGSKVLIWYGSFTDKQSGVNFFWFVFPEKRRGILRWNKIVTEAYRIVREISPGFMPYADSYRNDRDKHFISLEAEETEQAQVSFQKDREKPPEKRRAWFVWDGVKFSPMLERGELCIK